MEITKGQTVYYAQLMPQIPEFNVLELHVRTVEDGWYVGCENKSKHAYYFADRDLNRSIFEHRSECLEVVREAESHCKKKPSTEIYYEED